MTQLSQQIWELAAEECQEGGVCHDVAASAVAGQKLRNLMHTNLPTILAALELAEHMEAPGCVEEEIARLRRRAEDAEAFLDNAVSKEPEPLKELGQYLGGLLDEDQWAKAERYLNAVLVSLERGK